MKHDEQIQTVLKLPLEKLVGMFLWPSLEGSQITNAEKELLEKYSPSGIIFFRRNFKSLSQAKSLIDELKFSHHNYCKKNNDKNRPLYLAIDEEGGRVSRLPLPFSRGLPVKKFVDEGDSEGLKNQTLHQAFVAKGIGLNCLLAPVADVLTEPTNTVIGDRSFSNEENTVADYARVVVQVLKNEGVFSCAKHFPGHGNTQADTHLGEAVSLINEKTLMKRELLPFKSLIKDKMTMIMTAHIILPNVSGDKPATLNSYLLKNILREKLKFKGLILSDDLRMNAISRFYSVDKAVEASITDGPKNCSFTENDYYLQKAAIDALRAGCDILLSCQSIVREKVILEALIEEAKISKEFHQLLAEKAIRIMKIWKKRI